MTVFGGIVVESYWENNRRLSLNRITDDPRIGKISINLKLVSFKNKLRPVPYKTKGEHRAIEHAVLRVTGVAHAYVRLDGELVVTFETKGHKLSRVNMESAMDGVEDDIREVLAGISTSAMRHVMKERRLREEAEQREFDEVVAAAQAEATVKVHS